MKKYYYRNGQEVEVGDICFYSEDDGDRDYYYANSVVEIVEIVEIDGKLKSNFIYTTKDDGLTLQNTVDVPLELEYSCSDYRTDSNVLQHYIKLNNFEDNAKWVNDNFGRKNKKRKIDKFIKENLLDIPYKSRI